MLTKIVNYIRAGALNHRQAVALLEQHKLPHRYQVAQPGQRAKKSLGPERRKGFVKRKDTPELSDTEHKADLEFAVDMFA